MKRSLIAGELLSPDNSESLQLPGGQLSMTANLAAGLRQLRFLDRNRRLWVDAICINQKDNDEKGPQVALMAQVFRNAECVLVWLGVGNSAIYEAIEFMNDAANDSKIYGVQPELTFAANVTTRPNNEEGQALTELSNRTDPTHLGLFFGQAWFRRLWIVQEFVLASKFALYNGTSTLYEQAFTTALAIFFRMNRILGRDLVDHEVLVAVGSLIHTRDRFPSRSGEESLLLLYDVVETHGDRECTNDLDLIYGVLGLSTPYQDIELEIDYNIDMEDLFISFARKYLDRGYLEAFPRGNQVEEWSRVTSGLPSWVPDWRNKRITSYFPRDGFSAASGVEPLLILNSQSPRKVAIRGTLVDTVKVIATSPFEHHKPWNMSELQSYLSEIRSLYKTQHLGLPPGNAESVEHLFARLLVYDCRKHNDMEILRSSDPDYLLNRLLDFDDYLLSDTSKLPDTVTLSLNEFGCQASRARDYGQTVFGNLLGLAVAITEEGYLGLGSLFVKPGDVIAVFDGAPMASILRKVDEPPNENEALITPSGAQHWQLVGDCYIQGLMDNEVLESKYDDRRQTFVLV
jgi:hypothetical protein